VSRFPEQSNTRDNFDVRASLTKNRARGLWRLLAQDRWRYIVAIIALGFSALFNTLSLLLLRYLVDDLLLNPPEAFLLSLVLVALGFVGFSLLRGGFYFLSGSWAADVSEAVALRLRDFMFDHLQHLSFSYHDQQHTGELIQRSTSDIDAVRRVFAEQFVGIGRIVFLFTINFIAIMSLNWQLALASVIVIPGIMVLSLFFFTRVSKAWDRFQEQDAVLSNALQENLSGVRVVKAFAREDYEIERFEEENHKKFRLGVFFMLHHAGYWPLTNFITGFQMLFGYYLGAMMVLNGDLTLGSFVAYGGLVIYIIYPIRDMGRLIVQMSTGFVSYDRVAEIMREEWEDLGRGVQTPRESLEGEVVFENVNFQYGNGIPILHNISFRVAPGQTVALLGATGSGKTSLVNLLTRFYDYNKGSIRIDGIELTEYPRRFLREHVGLVEQESFLFSRSIRENITYGVNRDVSDEEVYAAARAAAVHDVIETFPEGYMTVVGERGVTLSGGQKQRVALARTLLKNPKILVLDDATSSVDTQTESEIRNALNNMMAKRTSFIIAHRIQSVMNADLILVFDHGRIVQRGTHEELMTENGIYRRTYEMQARIESEMQEELSHVGV
jgi:ATP-binding cassette subfamily B protein